MYKRKKIFRILLTALGIYLIVGVLVYLLQEKFLFHPLRVATDYKYSISGRHEEKFLDLGFGDTINYVKFLPDSGVRKGLMIYFHGNMNNIEYYAGFLKPFTDKGYEVWMPDYPSYGKSRGKLNEGNLLRTAAKIYTEASHEIAEDSLIIYGKSLGTGLASYVSKYRKIKLLILETPYSSVADLFRRYAWMFPVNQIVKYRMGSIGYLQNISCPVAIIHGTDDQVIPLDNARKLKPYLKKGDRFLEVKGAGHRSINRTPEYYALMDSLL